MENWLETIIPWLLAPETRVPTLRAREAISEIGLSASRVPAETTEAVAPAPTHLWPRWIFLRAMGFVYFSAFYALLFQIKGLIGPNGILPAADYLQAVAGALHAERFWYAPTLLWLGASDHALMVLTWTGLIASVLLFINFLPRVMLLVCFVCFLSFIGAAQDFSSYQSDGMLLEAGFICLFFAPPGLWPGLGRSNPPTRASYFMLLWEWFCIYFGSGVAKMASGDPSWRNFTAMDDYYQNGPLPTWIGWYVSHLPHWFHASAVFYTLAAELVLCWALFMPRRFRIALFFIILPFQVSIILTANYAFLNYIVLFLGFLLLDDPFIEWIVPRKVLLFVRHRLAQGQPPQSPLAQDRPVHQPRDYPGAAGVRTRLAPVRMSVAGVCLGLIFYTTFVQLFTIIPLPTKPITLLAPLRVADSYGLFARMTHARYEIEFQGSNDGKDWTPYPFKYKPQDVKKAPGLYAPYQPRFDWNLWFASLGTWQEYRFVIWTEERLLRNDKDVLQLLAGNPFAAAPPKDVRAVIYQYWFTDEKIKRTTGDWWTRKLLGDYAPGLEHESDGKILLMNTETVGDLPQ